MISVEARGLGGVSEVGWQGVGRRGATTERHQEPQTGKGGPLWGHWGNWGEIPNVYYVLLIKRWWYAKCWKLRILKEVDTRSSLFIVEVIEVWNCECLSCGTKKFIIRGIQIRD